jgi:hypothetical protein
MAVIGVGAETMANYGDESSGGARQCAIAAID